MKNIYKSTLLIPFITFTLNSCEEVPEWCEYGIVKDKIENKVYLTPLDDTTSVYRVINMGEYMHKSEKLQNIFLNMHKGDTVYVFNKKHKGEIPAEITYFSGRSGFHTSYNVIKINGVRINKLPDLVKEEKIKEEMRKAKLESERIQKEYEKAKGR